MNGPSITLTDENDAHGRPIFRLNSPYTYQIGPGCYVIVPAGFKTNFGTIPRVFYWLASPVELREAAIVHDWMCNESVSANGRRPCSGWSRWMADATLHEILVRIKFPWYRRLPVYFAVRAWAYFSKQRWPDAPAGLAVTNERGSE